MQCIHIISIWSICDIYFIFLLCSGSSIFIYSVGLFYNSMSSPCELSPCGESACGMSPCGAYFVKHHLVVSHFVMCRHLSLDLVWSNCVMSSGCGLYIGLINNTQRFLHGSAPGLSSANFGSSDDTSSVGSSFVIGSFSTGTGSSAGSSSV